MSNDPYSPPEAIASETFSVERPVQQALAKLFMIIGGVVLCLSIPAVESAWAYLGQPDADYILLAGAIMGLVIGIGWIVAGVATSMNQFLFGTCAAAVLLVLTVIWFILPSFV